MQQKELGIIGCISTEVVDLPSDLVARCDSEQAAMRLCIRKSRVPYTQDKVADILGLTKGGLNTILNSDYNERTRNMDAKRRNQLQRICGNRAINQWLDLELRGLLDCQRGLEQVEAELEAKLAEVRRQRGAA